MKQNFINENFLLFNNQAIELYHNHSKDLPIIDYHCHLPSADVANNTQFDNLSKIWLAGDHYKWRAMRSNGVKEEFCTGGASDKDKFLAWANTVPYTVRNPLYHWTHLELNKPFGISDRLLSKDTAESIWAECNEKLALPEFSAQGIMKQMNVELVCTTDDPIDNLEHHKKCKEDSNFSSKMLPTFRPDKGMAADKPELFNEWVNKLEKVCNKELNSLDLFIDAIDSRHQFFHEMGCRLSDHGLDTVVFVEFKESVVKETYIKLRNSKSLSLAEINQFKSFMLYNFGLMDSKRGWTKQIHIGALRNNNTRLFKTLGADVGFDSIDDSEVAAPLSAFLNRLDIENKLPKTILYNLNPKDNEVLATMIGNFQDGSVAGKMQYGSGWWFLDQKDGMEKQINALSSLGLLSRFVGMLTDSRSFLSYPRHEYFRRILCNLLGDDMKNGIIPNDMQLIGKMVEDISYNNAKNYFGF